MLADTVHRLGPFLWPAFAWLLTFAIHSTLLLGLAWSLSRMLRSDGLREAVWKTAVVGGLLTATVQALTGSPVHERWSLERFLESDPAARHAAMPLQASPPPAPGARGLVGPEVEPLRSRPSTLAMEAPTSLRRAADHAGPLRLPAGRALYAGLESGAARTAELAWQWTDGLPAASPALLADPPVADLDPVPDDPAAPRRTPWLAMLLLVVVLCWALAGAALVGQYLRQRARFHRQIAHRRSLHATALHRRLLALQERAGVRTSVRLTSSEILSSPIAFGSREICVPAAVEGLPREQQDSVLAHELAHLVRRDPAWLTLLTLLERALFFQPLQRLARRKLQECAEYLCDTWAARHVGHNLTLARTLAHVATWIEPHHAPPLAVGMAEPRSLLVRRIQRLLDHPTPRSVQPSRWSIPMSAALLSVVFCLAPQVTATDGPGTVALPAANPLTPVALPQEAPRLPAALPAPVAPPLQRSAHELPSAVLPPAIAALPPAIPGAPSLPAGAPRPSTFAAPALPGSPPREDDRTLGIRIKAVGEDMSSQLNLQHECWQVESVKEGSVAQRMGLQRHDVITHVNDQEIDADLLREALSSGGGITLRVIRGGQPHEFTTEKRRAARRPAPAPDRRGTTAPRAPRPVPPVPDLNLERGAPEQAREWARQARDAAREAMREARRGLPHRLAPEREAPPAPPAPNAPRARSPRAADRHPEAAAERDALEAELQRLAAEMEALAAELDATFEHTGREFEQQFEDLAAEMEGLEPEFEAMSQELAEQLEQMGQELEEQFAEFEFEFAPEDWDFVEPKAEEFDDMGAEFDDMSQQFDAWQQHLDQWTQQFEQWEHRLPQGFDPGAMQFDGEFKTWDEGQWEQWADELEQNFETWEEQWESRWPVQEQQWKEQLEQHQERWQQWQEQMEQRQEQWQEQRENWQQERAREPWPAPLREPRGRAGATRDVVVFPATQANTRPAPAAASIGSDPALQQVLDALEGMELSGGEVRLKLAPRLDPAAVCPTARPAADDLAEEDGASID